MWEELEECLHQTGTVEYGIYQRVRKARAPTWRRHKGPSNFRFKTVFNALFAEKGARNACIGKASYPKAAYSSSASLLVPYVATWLQGSRYGYLVRASAGDPEITIVSAESVELIKATNEEALSKELARIFADGARRFGIRLLGNRRIQIQPAETPWETQ